MQRLITCLALAMFSISIVSSCITTQRTYEGATAGGAVGAVAGALIDKNNRWRGAVIGGALGAIFGGLTTEISARAAREAAIEGRPVAYQSTDGWQRIQAEPVSYNRQTRCHKVRERIWQNNQLIKNRVREVCEGDKTEQKY